MTDVRNVRARCAGTILIDRAVFGPQASGVREARPPAAPSLTPKACHRSLYERHPDAVYSFDREGIIISVNPACAELAGIPVEELIGTPVEDMIETHDPSGMRAQIRTAVAGRAARYEAMVRHRSGRLVPVAITDVPIMAEGSVVSVLGIARDLSAQRQLEDQLRSAQRLEALGRLASGVAHDFNNILTIVQSYTELAMGELPEAGPARADLGQVLQAAAQGAALAKQLLAQARQQVLAPSVVDVNQAITRMAGLLRSAIGKGVRLETALCDRDCLARVDGGQLEQVLLNLAVNARDAMPHGGVLTLRTEVLAVDVAAAGHRDARGNVHPGDYVSITVEDTGVGIPAEVLPRIFEPFYTTKPPAAGTGLGLATVYDIVRQSGGAVTAQSALGKGARFVVLLPREAHACPPLRARSVALGPQGA